MTVTREEVLAQLETERSSAWAWYMRGDLVAHEDQFAYFSAYCLLAYDENVDDPEWDYSIEDICGMLIRDGFEYHNEAFFHAVDIIGQLL